MNIRNKILGALLALVLVACGGEDAFQGPGPGSPGGGNPPPAQAARLVLTSSAPSILADGSVTVEIRALLLDANNIVVPGVPVSLAADSGALSAGSLVTGEDGIATAVLSTGGNTTPRTIAVTATSGDFTQTVQVQVTAASSGAAAAAMTLSSSTASLPADGSGSAEVRALIVDSNNVAVAGVPVSFSATSGALSAGSATTGADGIATVTLSTGGNTTPRTIAVTATSGDFTQTVQVQVTAASSGATAAALTLTSSIASLPADGSVSAEVRALIVDSNNVAVAGVPVSFSATSGALSAGSTTTGPDGIARVTLSTGGNSTPRTIVVTATSGDFTQTVQVQVTAASSGATAAALTLSSSIASLPADGSVSAEVRALIVDSNNVAVAGVPVSFSATSGALSAGSATTGQDGIAKVTLTNGGDGTPRTVTVTASAAPLSATVSVAVGSAPSSTPVTALSLMSSVESIPSDGSEPATIVAIARDANNLLLPGVPVSFAATSGGLEVIRGITDSSGQAVARLSTAGDRTTRVITVTAVAADLTQTVNVSVAAAQSPNTIRIGRGVGAGFEPQVIGIAAPGISAGGSTSLSVTFVRQDNSLHTSPVTVTFNSPCVAAGTADFRVGGQSQRTVTTTTGQANITYVATGCVGDDLISATASVGGQNLEALGTIQVAPASVGSITFISASPPNIALSGSGDTLRPETSTLIFRVSDSVGGPVPNQLVNFDLSTQVGGISLSAASATSDAQGMVQVVVRAGTVATPVRVSATVAGSNPVIATQSNALTISTGIPTAGSFSISVDRHNIEGWSYDGTIATVTVRLADRFSNPVPDGTPVSFQAEGGSIEAQCFTETKDTEGGVCSVQLRSSNPRPADGRVSILATAIGEESFTDTNGNGIFDSGQDSFEDQPEPWLDVDENGVRDANEPFYDFFVNQTYDSENGAFNGVLCAGADCHASRTLGIGAQTVILFSGSNPVVTRGDGSPLAAVAVTPNSSVLLDFWVRDENGHPMPAGTRIEASVSGTGLSVPSPSNDDVPSSAQPANVIANGVTRFSYSVNAGATAGPGIFTLTVRTPLGVVTRYQFPITL
jgi:hypothetical protein